MYESRCGVACFQCDKYQKTCEGCLMIKQPFFGECKVKSCCEKKCHNHCGECKEFPCTMLETKGLAFGFDPLPNIERCRKWANE